MFLDKYSLDLSTMSNCTITVAFSFNIHFRFVVFFRFLFLFFFRSFFVLFFCSFLFFLGGGGGRGMLYHSFDFPDPGWNLATEVGRNKCPAMYQ